MRGTTAESRLSQGSAVARESLVGKIGTVIHPVRGGSRPGEVRVVVQGMPHYYIAYAAVQVPAGAEVIIVNSRGAQQVDIEPWPHLPVVDNTTGDAEGSP
jgi:membrane protein implicated in regulation of membrane protease activity